MSKSWALAAPEASTAAAMVTYVGGEESGGSGVAWVRWVHRLGSGKKQSELDDDIERRKRLVGIISREIKSSYKNS